MKCPECVQGKTVNCVGQALNEHDQFVPCETAALARVKAYVEAVPTLYDDEDPMPEGLTIDTATLWGAPHPTPRHDLTLADLQVLVAALEALR